MASARVVALVLLLTAGCGKYNHAPVSGRVTMDGKPLAHVMVRFQPTGGTLEKPNVGRGSQATTDEEGRFALRVNSKQGGAIVGKHRVIISKQIAQRELLPARYNSATNLTFEIPDGGTEEANFDLKAK